MRVINIFDDVAGGHHPPFLTGIVRETLTRGHRCLVACPHLDQEVTESPQVTWMPTKPGTLRRPAGGHWTFRAITGAWGTTPPDAFWDLYLDKNVWVLPHKLRTVASRIHVLHAINQYQTENRSPLGRARTSFLRHRIELIVGNGAVIVVHTRRAFEVLATFLPTDRLVLLGYPVKTPEPLPSLNENGRLRLLFVGRARREKGLFELLDAMEMAGRDATLEVVGSQPVGLAEQAVEQHPELDIRWTNRFVTDQKLRKAFHRCDLVVAPYLPVFQTRGGASGVLLQTLGEGVPLLTTPSLAEQLPDGYGGAIIAKSHNPTALADSITTGINDLSRLAASASTDGPAFTKAFHSYGNYVETLLRVDETGPTT